jgi:Uncharacterized protein conserved in bacteria (DUF2252)
LLRFRYADLARKVVGVGSVGTRCWVILLLGRDSSDPLFLQRRRRRVRCWSGSPADPTSSNQGRRVVEGQRLMQAASDIFLGWLRQPFGLEDLKVRDLYVRRAHARSGDSIAIGSYLGSSDVFDRATAAFAEAYADQTERDHAALLDAMAAGRIQAQPDR